MKKISLVLAASTAALVSGLLAAPALAAPPADAADVTVLVKDTEGEVIRHIQVSFVNVDDDEEEVELGTTNRFGEVSTTEDTDLYEGDWLLTAYDDSENRYEDKATYAFKVQPETLVRGANPTIEVVLDEGATISGKITAPSGRPLRHLPVYAWWFHPEGFEPVSMDQSAFDGTYKQFGLSAGGHRLRADITNVYDEDDEDWFMDGPGAGYVTGVPTVTLAAGEQKTGVDITNWKVRCTTSFTASSPSKGKVKLTAKATAPTMGLKNPLGKIVVKRGSTTVKTIPVSGVLQTYTVGGQPKGKSTKYTATYTGGDCLSWSASKTVKIKK